MIRFARTLPGNVHYAWLVLGLTFVTLLAAAAVRASPSVLIIPLEQAFGWSPATISFAISLNLLLYGLMGPFAAALMQRIGIRATVPPMMRLITDRFGKTDRRWCSAGLRGHQIGAGSIAFLAGALAPISGLSPALPPLRRPLPRRLDAGAAHRRGRKPARSGRRELGPVTLILSNNEVERLLAMDELITAVEAADVSSRPSGAPTARAPTS